MRNIDEFVKEYFKFIFVFFLLCSSIMYFCLTAGKYIWADEAYTLALIKHDYADIWRITAADVHPPLYYFLLKLMTSWVNYNLIATRIFSVIPYIFIICFGGIELKRLFTEKIALLFMMLFFFFPFGMLHVVEIRMYTLASAFVFVSAIYAYRCFKENKISNWMVLLLSGLGAAYTHYYALLSVGIVFCILLIALIYRKEKINNWFLTVIVAGILYIPWLKCFIDQLKYKVSNEYWIDDITFNTVIYYLKTLFGVNGLKYFFMLPLFAYLCIFLYICVVKKNVLGILSLGVPAGTFLVGIIVSLLVRPVFIVRYIVPSLSLLVFFMALSLSEIRNRIVIFLILIISIVGGASEYVSRFNYQYHERENLLDETYINNYDNVDAILFFTKSIRPPQEATYYIKDIPIYYPGEEFEKPLYPYENVYSLNRFKKEMSNNVIIIADKDCEIPQEYLSIYKNKYIGTVNLESKKYDAFLLNVL